MKNKLIKITGSLIFIFTTTLLSCKNDNTYSYEIVKTDNRDPLINLDVYVKDTFNLKKINEEIVTEYNQDKNKFLMINYYDDKEIARTYREKIFDENISEIELKNLDEHTLAFYNNNPTTKNEEFHFQQNK
jgi:hypothetical protein